MLIIAQALKEKWFKFQGFCPFTNNKQTCEWSCQRFPPSGQDRKKPPALETNQIGGFGGLRPLASLQKKKMNRFLQRVSWIKRATGTLDLRADQQLSKADVVGAWWCSLRQHNWAQAFFSFSIKMLFSFQLRLRNIIFSKLPNPALKRSEWKLSRNLKISFSWLIVISFL